MKRVLVKVQDSYDKRVQVMGNVVRVYDYEMPVKINKKGAAKRDDVVMTEVSPIQRMENLRKSGRRAKTKVFRIINSNFGFAPRNAGSKGKSLKFLTLTYKENMQDYDRLAEDWKKFIKRLEYRLSEKVQYVAVHERQKRGALHIHAIIYCSFIPICDLKRLWSVDSGKGCFKLNRIRDVGNVGSYVSKYVAKDIDAGVTEEEVEDRGGYLYKKRYWVSRGLKDKTIEVKFDGDDGSFFSVSDLTDFVNWRKDGEYKSKWLGRVRHTELCLHQTREVAQLLKDTLWMITDELAWALYETREWHE